MPGVLRTSASPDPENPEYGPRPAAFVENGVPAPVNPQPAVVNGFGLGHGRPLRIAIRRNPRPGQPQNRHPRPQDLGLRPPHPGHPEPQPDPEPQPAAIVRPVPVRAPGILARNPDREIRELAEAIANGDERWLQNVLRDIAPPELNPEDPEEPGPSR